MSKCIEITISDDHENPVEILNKLKDLFSGKEKVILLSRKKEDSPLLPGIKGDSVIVRSYSNKPDELANIPRGQSNTVFVIENTTKTDFKGFINNAMPAKNNVILFNVVNKEEDDSKSRKVVSIKIDADYEDPVSAMDSIIRFASDKTKSLNIKIGGIDDKK